MTAAADAIRQIAPGHERRAWRSCSAPGLGGVADAVEDPVVIQYDELPGFPVGSVAGHAGRARARHARRHAGRGLPGPRAPVRGHPAGQLAVPMRTATRWAPSRSS